MKKFILGLVLLASAVWAETGTLWIYVLDLRGNVLPGSFREEVFYTVSGPCLRDLRDIETGEEINYVQVEGETAKLLARNAVLSADGPYFTTIPNTGMVSFCHGLECYDGESLKKCGKPDNNAGYMEGKVTDYLQQLVIGNRIVILALTLDSAHP